jgi:hypothetical protein
MPLAGSMDLLAMGWGGGFGNVPLDVGTALAWIAVSALVFRRFFRWEPRG